jgi:hypothetical protein
MCSKWHPRRWRHTCIRRAKLSMTHTFLLRDFPDLCCDCCLQFTNCLRIVLIHMGTILKRQRSREIITGISVKKAKKILQTYHRIKEWEVNLFICYRKISRQKHVHVQVCEDMMQLKFMYSNQILQLCTMYMYKYLAWIHVC